MDSKHFCEEYVDFLPHKFTNNNGTPAQTTQVMAQGCQLGGAVVMVRSRVRALYSALWPRHFTLCVHVDI